MQLTSLEIFGFKSFAEKTKFVFDEGITGIVGPNGCGKSNIVDAIRWVLGEQKTRNLRSDKMENIIFNGTKKRRKSNYAEVSLTFENTKNILPTEFSTVTITRKLYRSGDSEYLLNGVICRLKDIQNLFLDTGVSSDSYAIIELKMVDEILTNKDNERRKFIEEAAGISKYKARKRQTLKRLSETDADLERVDDLLYEIEKNLKSLEKQARKTQRYFELKEEYKLLSSRYAWLSMQGLWQEERQLDILEENLKDQIIATQSGIAQKEARIEELKKEQLDREKALADSQSTLNEYLRKIQSVETEKSIKNERLKYLQQREIAVQDQIDTERNQISRNEEGLDILGKEMESLKRELNAQEDIEATLKAEVEVQKIRHDETQAQLEGLIELHRTIEQALQQLTRDKEIKGVQIASLEGELERAEEDKLQRSGDLDAFGVKGAELKSEIAALEARVEKLKKKQEEHEKALAAAEELVNEGKDELYKINRSLDARQNEYNLTRSLVENLEGFPESVKFLKKNAKWMKAAPLLSDIFSVPETYKVALENYLEPWLSHYVVATRKDAILSVHMLADSSKGRANFFVLEELENYAPVNPLLFTQAQSALDVVDFATEYRRLATYLLDKVYFVADEDDMPAEIPENAVFLTHSGNMSRRRFQMGGGSLGLFQGKRLGRAKNLENLKKEISGLERSLTKKKSALEKSGKAFDQLKKVNIRKELEPLNNELVARRKDREALEAREKEYQLFLQKAGERAGDLIGERDKLREELLVIAPQIKSRLVELNDKTAELSQLRETARIASEKFAVAGQSYNTEHIKLIHLKNQLQNLDSGMEQKRSEITRFGENRVKLAHELDEVKRGIDGLINSNHSDDEVIVSMYDQKKGMEKALGTAEQKLGMTKNLIRQVEEAMTAERHKMDEIRKRQGELQTTGTDLKLELNSLKERMAVEFQIELKSLDPKELFDKPIERYSVDVLEEKVQKIRQRVQNFGEINPLAVEAYNEMKERYDFIIQQKDDLIAAKQSLLDTIAEIDQTAKEKFLETFSQVKENFQKVFRSLFSEDDSCDLLLLNEENPLESEISIIARPKGKRPLTIKQLSGGEKTLTAVALLFSLYLIKPAPFCIFDEVDAPLDDANIDKFNNIVKDFSAQSQFIIVTHNKRTMASTNVMYGVTMEHRGISSVLPVDMVSLNLN